MERKALYTVLVACLWLGNLKAQDTQEIRKQIEQIAYLKTYGGLIKKGYQIAQTGLTLISDLKDKDFGQHQHYFKSLGKVNSMVSKSREASRAAELGKRIMILYYHDWRRIRNSESLSESEKSYVYDVYQRVIRNTHSELEQLEALMTNEKLVMKDGERFERIGSALAQMEDNYEFISRFSTQTLMLEESRKRSQLDAGLLNELLKREEP